MRKLFIAAVVTVIALAFVTAMLIPTPAGACPLERGKGKKLSCRIDPNFPPECPPCEVFDYCRCTCRKIPGCKLDTVVNYVLPMDEVVARLDSIVREQGRMPRPRQAGRQIRLKNPLFLTEVTRT